MVQDPIAADHCFEPHQLDSRQEAKVETLGVAEPMVVDPTMVEPTMVKQFWPSFELVQHFLATVSPDGHKVDAAKLGNIDQSPAIGFENFDDWIETVGKT